MKHRDVGLMLVDTSKPGWMVLHADCNNPRIDSRQAEGQSLWDMLKVPDVVSLSCSSFGDDLPYAESKPHALSSFAHTLLWVLI